MVGIVVVYGMLLVVAIIIVSGVCSAFAILSGTIVSLAANAWRHVKVIGCIYCNEV